MAIVYQATNLINGKRYVGVTGMTLDKRRSAHCTDAARGIKRVFCKALRKYGREAFVWEILSEHEIYADALRAEIVAIAALKPKYNVASGGQGAPGVVRSAETRRKISAAHKGRKISAAARESLIRSHTPERRKKMSEFMKGRVMSPQARERWAAAHASGGISNPIICLSDGLVFRTIKRAAQHYGVSAPNISSVLAGASTRAGKRYFQRYVKPMTEIERDAAIAAIKVASRARRQAALTPERRAKLEVMSRTRVRSPEERAKQAQGRRGKGHSISTRERLRQIGLLRKGTWAKCSEAAHRARSKPVICLNDGSRHDSASAAARAYGLQKSAVIEICNRDPVRKTAGRLVFRYEGDHLGGPEEAEAEQAAARKRRGAHSIAHLSKPLRCVTDGKIFARAAEAETHYGIHRSYIGEVCRGKKKTAHGLTFEYIE